MGRMLGAYDDSLQFDRPDLNKCPDCGCYFASDTCPVCGKVCPEEMRAGKRAPERAPRRYGSNQRTVFVEWYHSWWFIVLMLFVSPVISIVLLATSPHKKSHKITAIAVCAAVMVVSGIGVASIFNKIMNAFDEPVDTSLTREEYIAACEAVSPEQYYRNADAYIDAYVSMTLEVTERFTDEDGYYYDEAYTTYYMCRDTNGGIYEIMIRDCQQRRAQNFIAGDVITVFGEGAGNCTVYDLEYLPHEAPCIYVAYVNVMN